MPKPKAKKAKKPRASYVLKIRGLHESLFAHVWLIRSEGAVQSSQLHGSLLREHADDLAKVLQAADIAIEREESPFREPKEATHA